MDEKLKTIFRVQAFIRQCDLNFYSVAVVRKGDPDAGDIALKQRLRDGTIRLWRSSYEGWKIVLETLEEADIDSRLSRAVSIDSDLWVIEVDTPMDVMLECP